MPIKTPETIDKPKVKPLWLFLFVSVAFFVIILLNNFVVVKSEIIRETNEDCFDLVKEAIEYDIEARFEDCRLVVNSNLLTDKQPNYKIDSASIKNKIEVKKMDFQKIITENDQLITQKKVVLTKLNIDLNYQKDSSLSLPMQLEEQINFLKISDTFLKNKLLEFDTKWNRYLILSDSLSLNYEFTKIKPDTDNKKIELYKMLSEFAESKTLVYKTQTNVPRLEDLFKFKYFESSEFVDFSNKLLAESTAKNTEITGNKNVDREILNIAVLRGYKIRKEIDPNLLIIVDTKEDDTYKLSLAAKDAYKAMKKAGEEEGIKISLTSGYRSIDDQKKLFVSRFLRNFKNNTGKDFDKDLTTSSEAQASIGKTLEMTAPPGYSKHHSGITVDVTEDSPDSKSLPFVKTRAFSWLSKNNYYNSKRFGFVPSYPEGVSLIGPEPESWEYVFVSIDELSIN